MARAGEADEGRSRERPCEIVRVSLTDQEVKPCAPDQRRLWDVGQRKPPWRQFSQLVSLAASGTLSGALPDQRPHRVEYVRHGQEAVVGLTPAIRGHRLPAVPPEPRHVLLDRGQGGGPVAGRTGD